MGKSAEIRTLNVICLNSQCEEGGTGGRLLGWLVDDGRQVNDAREKEPWIVWITCAHAYPHSYQTKWYHIIDAMRIWIINSIESNKCACLRREITIFHFSFWLRFPYARVFIIKDLIRYSFVFFHLIYTPFIFLNVDKIDGPIPNIAFQLLLMNLLFRLVLFLSNDEEKIQSAISKYFRIDFQSKRFQQQIFQRVSRC